MPPLPGKPKTSPNLPPRESSAKPKRKSAKASEPKESTGRGDSGIGSSTKASPGRRTPTNAKLEEKIGRFYMMLGTVMRPFGRWYTPLTDVGDSVKEFSGEAAEAWMELAEENPEIKKKLEEWTSASIYGNIVGIHFAMFMAAAPGPVQQMASGDPIEVMRAMGATDQDIAMAMQMAGMSSGGPGDTVRSDRKDETLPDLDNFLDQQRQQAEKDLQVALNNQMQSGSPGIVTPDQLGVTRDGQENSTSIPLSGPPRGI